MKLPTLSAVFSRWLFLPLFSCLVLAQLAVAQSGTGDTQHVSIKQVFVKPVLLVPSDVTNPPPSYSELIMKHLKWCQARYRELLFGMDTFSIAPNSPLLLHSRHDAATWLATNDGGAELALIELFEHDKVDRFNCPFIYVVFFAGTDYPAGGARPINGGVNTGGGILVIGADGLTSAPNFQTTLQHELGHAFGLPHVDVYGYSMETNASIMSYNPTHHANGLTPSKTPGALIPEDYRVLNMNHRVFPHLKLSESLYCPAGYKISPSPVFLGPMQITGQPDYTGPEIGP